MARRLLTRVKRSLQWLVALLGYVAEIADDLRRIR
jgi:hypothetical protein